MNRHGQCKFISLIMTQVDCDEISERKLADEPLSHAKVARWEESGWQMPHVGQVDAVRGAGSVAQGALGGPSSCQGADQIRIQGSAARIYGLMLAARCNLRVFNSY
jgi:hypothetical protein